MYFEDDAVRLNTLRSNVKTLLHTVIRGDYRRKQKGKPVQCKNCQMLERGEGSCHMQQKYTVCVGQHQTADYPDISIVNRMEIPVKIIPL